MVKGRIAKKFYSEKKFKMKYFQHSMYDQEIFYLFCEKNNILSLL